MARTTAPVSVAFLVMVTLALVRKRTLLERNTFHLLVTITGLQVTSPMPIWRSETKTFLSPGN